jgi:hypothetical protein
MPSKVEKALMKNPASRPVKIKRQKETITWEIL